MKPFRITLIALLAASLTGCANLGDLAQEGADAADRAAASAEFVMCRGTSVGAVMRAYAVTPERWDAWLTLCGYNAPAPVQPPSVPVQ